MKYLQCKFDGAPFVGSTVPQLTCYHQGTTLGRLDSSGGCFAGPQVVVKALLSLNLAFASFPFGDGLLNGLKDFLFFFVLIPTCVVSRLVYSLGVLIKIQRGASACTPLRPGRH